MIITIFGDVHGNLIALEKLFEVEKSKTDLFICHGDVVNYGPWTNECVTFLNSENCKLLKGNHERYFLDGFYDGTNEVAKSFFEFCYGNFDIDLASVIGNYEIQELVPEFKILHTIGNKYIYADTDIADLKIDSNFIIGHSHQQYAREKGIYKIYNTGSLGQNREFINLSCYLTIDTETKKVEFKNFTHDINKVIQQMELQNYPEICLAYYKSKKQI